MSDPPIPPGPADRPSPTATPTPSATPTPTPSGEAYLVAPPGGRGGPGVLLLHPWWGLTPWFRRLADRLADEGFVVLAPDLHGGGRTADTPDEAEALLADTDPNVTSRSVLASVATLRGLPLTPDAPIGVVGFSMGASWALWLATRAPDQVGATVVFYGAQDLDFDPILSPIQGHFAEHDEFVDPDELVLFEAQLRLLDKDLERFDYPGTGHWFFEDDRPEAFVPAAAELAWTRTVAFLKTHLAPAN